MDFNYIFHTDTAKISQVLEDWLRVVKPGGYIVLSHETKLWPEWEKAQSKLHNEKKWKYVWRSNSLWYLPVCEGEEEQSRVRIFVYQKP